MEFLSVTHFKLLEFNSLKYCLKFLLKKPTKPLLGTKSVLYLQALNFFEINSKILALSSLKKYNKNDSAYLNKDTKA